MLLQLQKYDIRLQYTPEKEMYIADTLSRAYLKDLPFLQFLHLFIIKRILSNFRNSLF
jgi:hypothetical protein